MKTIHYSILAVLLFMVGCAPVQYSTVPQQKTTVLHQYELSVVDVDGNPLEGVTIEYTLVDHIEDYYLNYDGRIVKSRLCTTSSDGLIRDSLNITTEYYYIERIKSEFKFKASKDGFYSKSGSMSSRYGQKYSSDQPVAKDKITLIRPIDYFYKEFASTISDGKLKIKILNFIDIIILQGLFTESILETHSVNLVSFKGKNYLQFKFTNVNVYNSLRLNNYDIGKILFDEVIRKVLNPLNEYIADSDLFYGYDLTVVGHTKSFAEEYAISQPIEYRFMIPVNVVSKYKNKDISGQQVLDASVILMDDERIELKLQ